MQALKCIFKEQIAIVRLIAVAVKTCLALYLHLTLPFLEIGHGSDTAKAELTSRLEKISTYD